VTDVAEQFEGIEKLIKFMDTPAQQVEIEARLLSANKSFSREFGSQLALLVGANSGNMLTGGVGESSPFNRTPPPRVTVGGGGLPLLTNLPAAATSGVAFLLQPGQDILLDAIITAAEASGNARLLVAAQSNHGKQRQSRDRARYEDSGADEREQHDHHDLPNLCIET
jgi:type IV pilus assembly protein PilQ